MTLIKSISGIRGTIGGDVGDSLSPLDIVRFTASYADFVKKQDNSFNQKRALYLKNYYSKNT